MKLADLIEVLEKKVTYGPLDTDVTRITTDSRLAERGDLFVALRGTDVDGHDFVGDAIAGGASVVVTESPVTEAREARVASISNVVVDDTSKALAKLAARYAGDPAESLFLCGITGTNGKTSTAHMYRSIIEASGRGKMGIVGTLGHGVEGGLEKTPHTTPAPVELHTQFRKMADKGCIGVVMEVSSHAVRQHRTWGLDFEVGILTNVTHDHLDYHKTLEDYRAAKREFCESLVADGRRKPHGTLVYCADDPVAREIGEQFPGDKLAVVVTDRSVGDADIAALDVDATLGGTAFTLRISGEGDIRVRMKLLGSFCATNAALSAAGARATGIGAEAIKSGLESIERIPGRFETVGGGGKPVVIIDYSHTPDSMARVLRTCRDLNPGHLTTVFGCGGDRDRKKRPLMGKTAQSLSDLVYVTMDNPRTEPVASIVDDILAGMDRDAGGFVVDLNRSRAIRDAVAGAGADDLVVLLGKGVEAFQVVGTDHLPFSDRREAEGALKEWQKR